MSLNERKMKKRQLNREIIIKYAEKEFKEKGYVNSRVEDIAFNSGNAKATIYNYFESKEDILVSIISNAYRSFTELLLVRLKENNDRNDLRIIFESYLYFDTQFPYLSELLNSNENMIIEKKIFDKIDQNISLTESEKEYRESEDELAKSATIILTKYLNNTITNADVLKKLVQVIAHFLLSIRQVIMTGKLVKQSNEQTKETLDIMVKIIELGIKNYK